MAIKSGGKAAKARAVQYTRESAGAAHLATQYPENYALFLQGLKARIRVSQVKASLAANRELIELYWDIGRAIVKQQKEQGWGKAVVEQLSRDLQTEFPGLTGFSPQNIWYMRSFYLAWTVDAANLQQPVGDSPQTLDAEILPQAVGDIPWGHNLQLLSKLKDPLQRLWYARQTIQNGWSRAVLVHQIETNLFSRLGKADTNFDRTLPPPQSDLARQILKDSYVFDFLTLAPHLRLRCFVVVDLKVEAFKPEFAGKMNFYLSAADDRLRHPTDAPTIGILLCKSRSKLIVEYALRDTSKPIGVAEYRVGQQLPANVRDLLPSPEALQAVLEKNSN